MRPSALFVFPLVAALVLSPAAPAVPAPQAPPQGKEVLTFGVSTAAVTLDIVVRDKKGNAVRDLKAGDFSVFEDGVPQKVETFEIFGQTTPPAATTVADARSPVGGPGGATAPAAASAPAASPAPAAAAEPEVRPQVIAFVFDRLGPEARANAQKAAMTYVDRGYVHGDVVGIFSVDLALRTLQPFTTDVTLIRSGLERAAAQGNTGYANNREQVRNMVDTVMQGADQADSVAGSSPGRGANVGDIAAQAAGAALQQTFGSLQLDMARNMESLERDQQGFASTNGLLAVVTGLKKLPGRKTVVFFSEGLMIPANVLPQFRNVIHNANRSNVSVYTMDAAGLRAQSSNLETAREINQATAQRLRELESGHDSGTSGPSTRALERAEDRLRDSAESGLGMLANETGAFMIRDTNDAAGAFRRITEDMRFHYLVGYTPSNEVYDGKFRVISVKVARPGVTVQSRQGYIALKTIESAPLLSYEAPAIAKLDAGAKPHDFPIQIAALTFPTTDKPGLSPVLVKAPGTALTFTPDPTDKSADKLQRGDFAVVVRVKDASGREVDRLSQHFPLSAPAKNVEAARRGDILFYREAELGPGKYTLEAVGYDAGSQKASVATASLEVHSTQPGKPRLSSVILVGRAEKVAAGDNPGQNPLYFGDTILYPAMGEPFRKATSQALGFFFTVYSVPASSTVRRATLEIYRDGTPAGQVATELPAPDANGRIQYAGSLPLAAFPPGSYRLKVTAATTGGSDAREATFTIAE